MYKLHMEADHIYFRVYGNLVVCAGAGCLDGSIQLSRLKFSRDFFLLNVILYTLYIF